MTAAAMIPPFSLAWRSGSMTHETQISELCYSHALYCRCPDGSVALAQCEDASFRFIQM